MKSSFVLDLIRAHATGSEVAFKQALDGLIEDEYRKGNVGLSVDLRDAWTSGQPSRNVTSKMSDDPLVRIRPPSCRREDVSLSKRVDEELDSLIGGFKERAILERHGIRPVSTVLLQGPPGCGKTMVANAIASELGMDVATVDLGTMISSYMGQTGTNIGKAFDAVRGRNAVLFMDEFDAVAKFREDSMDNGESKRIVGSLLQNLDSMDDSTLVIAATNLHGIIDPAIKRRFEMQMEVGLPDYGQRVRMAEMYLDRHGMESSVSPDLLARVTEGRSGWFLTNLMDRASRSALQKGGARIDEGDVFTSLIRQCAIDEDDTDTLTGFLSSLHVDQGIPYTELSRLSGIKYSTLYRKLKAREA